ncbi:Hypothetical_protein [Hexamita inflata]|uniref:Hypothetical_protein n=1 Tax=Hexamita inflata TaxID=28002 RepID=A0ABP1I7C1_9EUKA
MLAHYFVVMRTSVQKNTKDLNILLRVTVDVGSFYSGCLTAYYFYDRYPLKNMKETKIGALFVQYLPKKFWRTLLLYSVIALNGIASSLLFQTNTNLINIYHIQKLINIVTMFMILGIYACGCDLNIKFLNKISRSDINFLLVSEVVTFNIANSIGEIQIGPYNKSIIFLSFIGIIALVLWVVQMVDYLWIDIIKQFVKMT